ncbi:MAG: CRISPR-associated endoribonuclease Cas6 [Candidatus Methanoperedens sp.]|nr:CRISPR-associated endoribonuclease Cas6 [Candidatus Methanoperedens sp.]
MRGKITIYNRSKVQIDYNYQYGIASMLYLKLAESDVKLANEMHSHQGFKFYTFSNLTLEDKKQCRTGLDFDRAHFFLSSPDERFIRSFAEGLLMNPGFYLEGVQGRVNFTIERIEILPAPEFGEECTFKTISPIYVKTQRNVEGKLKEFDLYPSEPKFYENLHKNLIERYSEFYGSPPEKEHFEVVEVSHVKPRRIRIAQDYRRCSLMHLRIQANPELLKFAYDAGLGEKNAMGFGYVDLMNSSQQLKNLTADSESRLGRAQAYVDSRSRRVIGTPMNADLMHQFHAPC